MRAVPTEPRVVTRTGLPGPAGRPGPNLARRYDPGAGIYAYIGLAVAGADDGAAVWTVRRLEYAAGVYVATLSATEVTWTGRAGHDYA